MKLTNLQINALTSKVHDMAIEDFENKIKSFDDSKIVSELEVELRYKEQLKIIDAIDELAKKEKELLDKLRLEFDGVRLVSSYDTKSEYSRYARKEFQNRVSKRIKEKLSIPSKEEIQKEIVFLTIEGGGGNIVESLKEHFKIGQ